MERTYLDKPGLGHVIEKVNKKLTVTDAMPAADIAYIGKQYLYVGADTADLIKGGIYECQEVPDSSPVEYTWVCINTADVNLTYYIPAWKGAEEDWNELTDEEKSHYELTFFNDDTTDDGSGGGTVPIDAITPNDERCVKSSALAEVLYWSQDVVALWENHEGSFYQSGVNVYRHVMPNSTFIMQTILPKISGNYVHGKFQLINIETSSYKVNEELPNAVIPQNPNAQYVTAYFIVKNTSNAEFKVAFHFTGNATGSAVSGSLAYIKYNNLDEVTKAAMAEELKTKSNVMYVEVDTP